jgi:hypothetical protein
VSPDVLALRRLRDWRGGGGDAFGEGTLISSPILDKGYIHFIPTIPRINIDGLKADRPDATKKYEDTQNDEKEMSGR